MSNVRKAFFEADVEGAPSFADVELSAFGAMNDVSLLYVRQLNCFVMFISDCGPWPVGVGVGANGGTCSAICLITVIGVVRGFS